MAGPADLRAGLADRLPPFRPLFPWIGGDLQTVRNWLTKPRPPLGDWPAETIEIDLADGTGDRLVGLLQRPHEERDGRPLVLLVHGLTGSAESSYMRVSAAHLLRAGYPVLRLNLRGAGPTAGRSRSFYHAGRSDDLATAVAALRDRARHGLVVVGYSLGANLVLKYLAEQGAGAPVLAGAAISPPIDLHAAQLRLAEPRNRLYHRNLLQWMLRERGAALPDGIRTILDFDERVVAPEHGFKDALDYYRQCSAGPLLGAIRRPTLVIHADDDPWIPSASHRALAWSANPQLVPLLTRSGGHVGFHAAGLAMPWHDAALRAFLAGLR